LDNVFKLNEQKITFIIFTRKTNGKYFASKLDSSPIALYLCVKDIGLLLDTSTISIIM